MSSTITPMGNAGWKVMQKGSGGYVARCEPLSLSVEGADLEEVAKAAVEAVERFLAAANEDETLAELRERLGLATQDVPQFAPEEQETEDHLHEVRQFLDQRLAPVLEELGDAGTAHPSTETP